MQKRNANTTSVKNRMQAIAYANLQKTESVSLLNKALEWLFVLCVFLALVISLTKGWYGYALIVAVFAILYEVRDMFK